MRIGHWEIPGGLLVMPAFVLVVAILVLWTWYYYSRQTKEMQRLAASRGWTYLGKDSPELGQSLNGMGEHRTWRPENIILVETSPVRVYLFNYQSGDDLSDAAPEHGTACLTEGPGGPSGDLVVIDPRPPFPDELLGLLLDHRVEVGGPEFRRRFMVCSRRPDVAKVIVNQGVEEIVLLRHASNLKWDGVWIAGKRVLVAVTHSLKPEERDELIDLAKRLRAALP